MSEPGQSFRDQSSTQSTSLPTTGEFMTSPDGVVCAVLDTAQIDFSQSQWGRKKAPTTVRLAEEGEGLGQTFEGGQETFEYVTKAGDAIFVNSPTDQYVPSAKDGGRLQFDQLEENGYKIVSSDGQTAAVLSPAARLLPGVVDSPVCIKNAWGAEDKPENHQFLFSGATLKISDDGKVTGMDEEGFEKWQLEEKSTGPDVRPII